MNSTKYIINESDEGIQLFGECKVLMKMCCQLNSLICDVEIEWRMYLPGSNADYDYLSILFSMQELEKVTFFLIKLVKALYKLSPKLVRFQDKHDVIMSKRDLFIEELCRTRFILMQSLNSLIDIVLKCCLHSEDPRKLIETALSLITPYNDLIGLSSKTFVNSFNVCSNACPTHVQKIKKYTVNRVTQILARSRGEYTCHKLVDCLVKMHKPIKYTSDYDNTSTSSIEIYHALTKYLSPQTKRNKNKRSVNSKSIDKRRLAFIEARKDKMRNCKSMIDIKNTNKPKSITNQNSDSEVPYTSLIEDHLETNDVIKENHMDTLNGMLHNDDFYIEILLDAVLKHTPNILSSDATKNTKSGGTRVTRAFMIKTLECYQKSVWSEVGSSLEHIIIWWSDCHIASRSPGTCQNLREWLNTFNSNNTPDLILGALQSLADALGCHVTLTSWDKYFGLCLVTDINMTSVKLKPDISLTVSECTVTGANFVIMLQDLVHLSNQCEVSGEYIMGATIDELPIVEQIPILHRLDHSIHTCRLWCLAESRKLANMWEMRAFFRIVHNDIPGCLEQLTMLRFADHTIALETGKDKTGVHETVCAKMREKLVSEIKVNIKKLKDSVDDIVQMLSSVCTTICLANLTMIFPSKYEWRIIREPPDSYHSSYVPLYLDRVFLPVLKATEDLAIVNMILRIMCESWLNHIYICKVKFSKKAALQLLADFNEVKVWIENCNIIRSETKKHLLNNEVLRRCEGVGRLLLHSPGDPISMQDTQNTKREVDGELMPAEMYVPNQKQWLTLRAKGPNIVCCPFMYN